MKALVLAALVVFGSADALAHDSEGYRYNELRAIALVRAKFLNSETEENALYAIKLNNDGAKILVERTSVGGPCEIRVVFKNNGAIQIGNLFCQPGS